MSEDLIEDELTGLMVPRPSPPVRRPGALGRGVRYGTLCVREHDAACPDCEGRWQVWRDEGLAEYRFVHLSPTRPWRHAFDIFMVHGAPQFDHSILGALRYLHAHEVHPPL